MGQGRTYRVVLLGRDREDLGFVARVFGHDDERARTLTFDVELDPAHIVEPDVEGDARILGDCDAPVGDDQPGRVEAAHDRMDRFITAQPADERVLILE